MTPAELREAVAQAIAPPERWPSMDEEDRDYYRARAGDALRVVQAERDAAQAEAARLREALEKIAARDPNAVGSGKRAIEYDLMRYEARAALAKEQADD